jgi:hypothetical protein
VTARRALGVGALALAVVATAGCGGSSLNQGKIDRCAAALVQYDQANKGTGKGISTSQTGACHDLNANEGSEAIAKMYKLEGDNATTGPSGDQ